MKFMNLNIAIISLTFLICTMMLATHSSGILGVSDVHSPEFQFEKNYANSSGSAQTGINRTVTAAGMVENDTMTAIKLNPSIDRYSK